MTNTHPYLLSNTASQEETRFAALSSLFDETTFRRLGMVGIRSGRGGRVHDISFGFVGAGKPIRPRVHRAPKESGGASGEFLRFRRRAT
jgi:hypothetical protein